MLWVESCHPRILVALPDTIIIYFLAIADTTNIRVKIPRITIKTC